MTPSRLLGILLLPAALAGRCAPPGETNARQTGRFEDPRLTESSGVVVSRRHPGVLWTMNDSGGEPALFATDTAGRALGMPAVPEAANVDWEALGIGPCGGGTCLYIGDTGDNDESRPAVVLYRVPEPDPKAAGAGAAERLAVRYSDGAHDVEALYVEPDGGVVLVTKGRSGGVRAYRVDSSAWTAPGLEARATLMDSLPIPRGNLVTDAAISQDGTRVAVRTYRDIWLFRRDVRGRLQVAGSGPLCGVAGLEPQGEAIAWWDERTFVLTSEKGRFQAGPITLVQCPLQ
ncbi:MAG: hypothetical protein HOP28_13875 [Gemmatimonadales bacterium]|nr:hypothetical protein [Gemmatimonadales bacterium]